MATTEYCANTESFDQYNSSATLTSKQPPNTHLFRSGSVLVIVGGEFWKRELEKVFTLLFLVFELENEAIDKVHRPADNHRIRQQRHPTDVGDDVTPYAHVLQLRWVEGGREKEEVNSSIQLM